MDPAALGSIIQTALSGKTFEDLNAFIQLLSAITVGGDKLFENVIPGVGTGPMAVEDGGGLLLGALVTSVQSVTPDTANGVVQVVIATPLRANTTGTSVPPIPPNPVCPGEADVMIVYTVGQDDTVSVRLLTGVSWNSPVSGIATPNDDFAEFDNKPFLLCTCTPRGRARLAAVENMVEAEADQLPVAPEICFPANTPIKTDQGTVMIQDIDVHAHTINGRDIQYITKTKTSTDHLICFEKNAVRRGYPRRRTIMSREHCVVNNGKLYPAYAFVGKLRGVYKVPYTNETLYNILMENHEIIDVNGLKCETLHPENAVAQFYKQKYKLAVKSKVKTYLRTRDISALAKSELASLSALLR